MAHEFSSVKILGNATAKLGKILKSLATSEVLVGIAEDSRKDRRPDGEISNSRLGWAMEKGMPAKGVPPRPFLEPGVKAQRSVITEGLMRAGSLVCNGRGHEADRQMKILGLRVASGVKQYMSTADYPPLKPSTIANRWRQRGTQSKRLNEKRYIKKGGKTVPNPKFGEGIRPLINTGTLRNAIDAYVIKDGEVK